MKNILKVILGLLIIAIAYGLYFFPIQKHFAEKNFKKYISLQNTSSENIKSKKIYKNYKTGGYSISTIYLDDPDYTYEYLYFPNEKKLTDRIHCIIYDNQNVDVSITGKKVKYPPIN